MSGALVDFPLYEARALLKRLGPDGASMTAAECDAAERGRRRIEGALGVEEGAGGSAHESLAENVRSLVGQKVEIETTYGVARAGRLRRVASSETAILENGRIRQPIAVALIRSIRPVGAEQGIPA